MSHCHLIRKEVATCIRIVKRFLYDGPLVGTRRVEYYVIIMAEVKGRANLIPKRVDRNIWLPCGFYQLSCVIVIDPLNIPWDSSFVFDGQRFLRYLQCMRTLQRREDHPWHFYLLRCDCFYLWPCDKPFTLEPYSPFVLEIPVVVGHAIAFINLGTKPGVLQGCLKMLFNWNVLLEDLLSFELLVKPLPL